VKIPDFLLQEFLAKRDISPVSKIVWVAAAKCCPAGITGLSLRSGIAKSTALETCRDLETLRWMRLVKAGRKIQPVALIPHEYQVRMAEELERASKWVATKGEFFTKRHLDMWVNSDEYIDNARPEFLVNPRTGERLEYDRYYTWGLAIDFNETQHFITTQNYPSEAALKELKARDLMKIGLSENAGVRLVVITAEDLLPDAFVKKLPEGLPLNTVDRSGPYFRALVRLSSAYADTVEAIMAQATRKQ
jgi:hypothetical protein